MSGDNWVKFADWTLGNITDHEYADYLQARLDSEEGEDPAADWIEQQIVDRLRSLPAGSRYTDVRSPGETPADRRFLQ